MSSFDWSIQCDEAVSKTLTDAERVELEAWFEQQTRNAWQDMEDATQQGQDDEQILRGEF